MSLNLNEYDCELVAYPHLKFESVWQTFRQEDLATTYFVFSGRAFRDNGLWLEEVIEIPPNATRLSFREDYANRDFDHPPDRFQGESIAHLATGDCGDDFFVFLNGGHLIQLGVYAYFGCADFEDPLDGMYSVTRFMDDAERCDWPTEFTLADLQPASIRFLSDSV